MVGIIFVFSYYLASLNCNSIFINGICFRQSSGSYMPGSRVGSVAYYLCDFGQVSLYITAHITKYALYGKSVLICTQTQYKWKEKFPNQYLFLQLWMHSDTFFSIQFHFLSSLSTALYSMLFLLMKVIYNLPNTTH